jgi:16S rRNA (cytosine1402-N4)-methyltransferase
MMIKEQFHTPVMLEGVLCQLDPAPGKTIVDATVGTGGHAEAILRRIMPGGRLIGIDRDQESLAVAKEKLEDFAGSFELIYGNFMEIESILKNLRIKKVDGILFDLGISSFQLSNPERGFGFQYNGPLDMRMDRNSYISAYDLINNLTEEELSNLLRLFGQERWHNRIARFLVRQRQTHPINTTEELTDIVVRAIPYSYQHYRIHPATRTFQAMRIAVNRELETLETALTDSVELLAKGGRLCVISFHSLEDRVAKLAFRKASLEEKMRILTNKPQQPPESEKKDNPSSRSAKLRAAERR